MREIRIGYTAEKVMDVTEERLACTVGSGSLRVLATPMMAALMEAAACKAVASFLEGDETTVGTALNIQHTAATPEGMTVTARAEITGVNGREITFRVTAFDEAGEIGSGEHTRFVVYAGRFQEKAEQRGCHD